MVNGIFLLHTDADHHFALFSKLDRIIDQIDQNLAQAGDIPHNRSWHVGAGLDREIKLLLIGAGRKQLNGALQAFAQIKSDHLQVQLAGFDLREIEDVIDNGKKRIPAEADDLGEFLLLRIELRIQQQAAHPNDRVHRGADLVTHCGQEGALGARGGLRLKPSRFRFVAGLLHYLEKARILQRQAHPIGQHLHQAHIIGCVQVRGVIQHQDHAHDLTPIEHRDIHTGLSVALILFRIGDGGHNPAALHRLAPCPDENCLPVEHHLCNQPMAQRGYIFRRAVSAQAGIEKTQLLLRRFIQADGGPIGVENLLHLLPDHLNDPLKPQLRGQALLNIIDDAEFILALFQAVGASLQFSVNLRHCAFTLRQQRLLLRQGCLAVQPFQHQPRGPQRLPPGPGCHWQSSIAQGQRLQQIPGLGAPLGSLRQRQGARPHIPLGGSLLGQRQQILHRRAGWHEPGLAETRLTLGASQTQGGLDSPERVWRCAAIQIIALVNDCRQGLFISSERLFVGDAGQIGRSESCGAVSLPGNLLQNLPFRQLKSHAGHSLKYLPEF